MPSLLIAHLDLQETPVATPVRKRTPEFAESTAGDVTKVAKTTDESQLALPPTSDTTRKDDTQESEQVSPGDQQVDGKPAAMRKEWFNGLTRRQAQRCHFLCVRKLYCIEQCSCFLLWSQIA